MDEIDFYCNSCGASLTARAETAGRNCVCPQCSRVTPIPGSPDPLSPAQTLDSLRIEVRLRCHCCGRKLRVDCCGRKLRVDARTQSAAPDCPACSGSSKVPARGVPLQPATPERSHPRNKSLAHLSPEECQFLSSTEERAPLSLTIDTKVAKTGYLGCRPYTVYRKLSH
jgi:hypothetical protein